MSRNQKTIAVLPLQSFLDQPSEEYFADGMTELIISELGKLGTSRVISMGSSIKFKGSEASYQEIGRDLGADLLLDASFMRTDEILRLRLELIDAKSKSLLWRSSYEKHLREVYGILADISEAVGGYIASDPPVRLKETIRVDPASFDIYLRGLHHWSKSTENDYKQAIQCHIESLKSDPVFAPAYGVLAACYGYLGFWGHLPLRRVYPRAKLAAEKALEINPQSVDAHTALALVHWLLDWNLEAAETSLKSALEINPSHATARWTYGIFLGAMRAQFDDALAEMSQVRSIDPLSPMPDSGTGWISYWGRQFADSKAHFSKTLEANEEITSAWQGLGLAGMETKEFDEALGAFHKALAISGDPYSQGLLGLAYARSGDSGEACRKLDDLLEKSKEEWIPSLAIAWIYIGLNNPDEAFVRLAKAIEERDPQIFWLKAAALYDPLRSDPRLDELQKKIGIIQ